MHFESAISSQSSQQQFTFPTQAPEISGYLGETSEKQSYEAPARFSRANLVRSVAEEAGLGRFVYLRGHSGQRYIFSAIEPRRAGLYSHALFAVADKNLDSVVITEVDDVELNESQVLYVHLLADGGPTGGDVVKDLKDAHRQLS